MYMNLDIEEIKHAEKSQKMYQEFLIYVEHENVEFDRNESKNLELQLKEKIHWFERYLNHLGKGGKRIKAGADYWAQHENHYLTIEYGEDEQGNIEQDMLFIWCETCSDIVSSYKHEKSKNNGFSEIKNHLGHSVVCSRENRNQKTVCLICNDCEKTRTILCSEVSDWFDEI